MEIDAKKLIPFGEQLIVSVNGPKLTEADRHLLATVRPGGIILFSENIDGEGQLGKLISDIKGAAGPETVIAVDFEGGMVNRFRRIIGIIGDVAAMSDHEDLAEFGRESGHMLKRFGVDVNFAPVVDIDRGNRRNGLFGRTLGQDATTVIECASAYLEGLESSGVTGCLKHYPGLGPTTPDSHFGLPLLPEVAMEDEIPFRELANTSRWIMVAHVKITGYRDISTYSKPLLDRLRSFHSGSIVSDDLGMKALPDVPLHEKVEKTLSAGMDYALVRLRR
ncbi:MAG: glycoside hydrolase family 3 protein [Acidobacteria bacterium]|nr:glycoside hydrolase family 3 protein [Acidobacteriota bacterium]